MRKFLKEAKTIFKARTDLENVLPIERYDGAPPGT